MDRLIVRPGSKQSFSHLFTKLQDYLEDNKDLFFDSLFSSKGVILESSSDTSLKPVIDNGNVVVSPGIGITASNELIYISALHDLADRTIPKPANNTNIYVKYITKTDTPVDVAQDFVWNLATNPQEDTHQYGYFEITTTDPGDDGILIGQIDGSGNLIDLRMNNRAEINQKLIPNPGPLKGTTLTDFYIGVGVLGNNFEGLKVMVEPPVPQKPLRPRIKVIKPIIPLENTDPLNTSILAPAIQRGQAFPKALVTFEWGYTEVYGTPLSEGQDPVYSFKITTFEKHITPDFMQFGADELAGYNLYQNGQTYVIKSNAASTAIIEGQEYETKLEVVDENGNLVRNLSTGVPVTIHSNATHYTFEAIPVKVINSQYVQLNDQKNTGTTNLADSPVTQAITMELMGGWEYKFRVAACNGAVNSEAVIMPGGSYYYNNVEQNYSSPFLVKIPNIDMTGANISADTTPFGFTLHINGMDEATDFEIAYTTNSAGASFTDRTHRHIITDDRSIDIETSGSQTYHIAVRPLRNGFVVCDPAGVLTTTVVSGAGSLPPNEKILPYITVDLLGFSATRTSIIQTTPSYVELTIGDQSFTEPPEGSLVGKKFTDAEGRVFNITHQNGNVFRVAAISDTHGKLTELNVTGTVYFGNFSTLEASITPNALQYRKRTRFVYQHTFDQDVQITSIDFDCDTTDGTASEPAVLRFYQKDYDAGAKVATFKDSDYFYSQVPLNLFILGSKGTRTLIIDGWDPSNGPSSSKQLKGILTVHYRDLALNSNTLQTGNVE